MSNDAEKVREGGLFLFVVMLFSLYSFNLRDEGTLMLIVDVETCGQNPHKSSIISIGAVYVAKPCSKPEVYYGECRVPTDTFIDPESLAVNGCTLEDIMRADKLSLSEALLTFFSWTGSWGMPARLKKSFSYNNSTPLYTIFGHNPDFDREFLYHNAKQVGLRSPFGNHVVDLHAVCASTLLRMNEHIPLYKERSALRADTIFEIVGIGAEPKPHVGWKGAVMTAEAFHRLIYGRYLFEEYKDKSVPRFLRY